MTTYKHITAKTNPNGELEFHARENNRPLAQDYIGDNPYPFLIAVEKWEQSAQVFTAASIHEENKIKQAVIDSPEWKGDLPMNYKLGIDVTNFVSIENVLSHIDAIGVCFAFYKSPSSASIDDIGEYRMPNSFPPSKEETQFCMAISEKSLAKDWDKEEVVTEPEEIKCGDVNKFYRCVNCDEPCGSDGHFIARDKSESQESIWIDIVNMFYNKFTTKISDIEFMEAIKQYKITRLPKA